LLWGRIGARAPYFLHYSTIISATTILFGLSMFLSMNSDWATSASMVFKRTGRPAYHPATLLKIYVYGYLNRVQSSRRLERECQRNIELVWLTGRLAPDFKTIADFRKDNGEAIRNVCREFVVLCRRIDLFSDASIAIDGRGSRRRRPRLRGSTRRLRRCAKRYSV
jgi:hypothetical protein